MPVTVADPIVEVREILTMVDAMRQSGWTVDRTPTAFSLTKTSTDLAGLLAETENTAREGVKVRADGRFEDMTLSIIDPGSTTSAVTNQSAGNPANNFEQPYQSDAVDAWQGDADAALRLPGKWTVRIECDLRPTIERLDTRFDWKLFQEADDVERVVSMAPWRLGPVLNPGRPIGYLVETAPPGDWLVAGSTVVSSIDATAVAAASARAADASPNPAWNVAQLPESVPPTASAPVERRGSTFQQIERTLWQATAAMSWVGLATNAQLFDSKHVSVEIFGLQRAEHVIPETGIGGTEEDAQVAYDLYRWASSPDAVDQHLATLQVASLYRETPPWDRPGDVFKAARAVFNTLRRDAVSEVFESRRATRALAVEVAHKAVDATAAMARSTAERCVATFLAVGAVVVAQSAQALTPEVALKLRVLLAVVLAGLALWNVFIESPSIAGPLRSLKTDIQQIGDFLTPEETDEVLKLDAIVSAQRRLTVARTVIPAVYLIAAVVSLVVG